jgi:hypothetical protein
MVLLLFSGELPVGGRGLAMRCSQLVGQRQGHGEIGSGRTAEDSGEAAEQSHFREAQGQWRRVSGIKPAST